MNTEYEKEYPLPKELHDLFDDYYVSIQCRDAAIQSVWKAKRAIYYGKLAEAARRKAWAMVKELYEDEYMNNDLVYLPLENKLVKKKAEQ